MKTATKKLLIVEDESSVNYALSLKFKLFPGIELFYAKDGQEGLRMALEKKPNVILLDIVMPKMDGIEMFKRLRQDDWGKSVKVIILSNLSDPNKEQEAKNLGAEDYIIKAEWKINDIVAKVAKSLELSNIN